MIEIGYDINIKDINRIKNIKNLHWIFIEIN